MNFFKAQDKAKRHTGRLVFLFFLAVVFLIVLTNVLFIGTFAYMGVNETESFSDAFIATYDPNISLIISAGVSLLIIIGSLYKTSELSKGGSAIAEMLGGQVVPHSTTSAEERKLLNIVEEMSIAAGMPIPQVYILEEASINAFAAGQSHSNAVIGVTRGALSSLTRDELQGVIAHEFSHILNGDMKLNLRLMGILHGILLIGIIGEHILRSMRYRTSSKKNSGGAILFIGFGLFVIGYAGTFFGKWIKASVSRQREYLADASAVQFTRNKNTIAGALKKIGGLEEGSILETPSASEYSHAYFSDGISSFLGSIFSTHPPLKERIKRVDPDWNGRFIVPKLTVEEPQKSEEIKNVAGVIAPVILATADQIINQAGTLNESNIGNAHQLILDIPIALKNASQSPYSARAVLYTLLIREQKDKTNAWKLLEKHADISMPALTKQLIANSESLDEKYILPLLELCVSSLRELSKNQYAIFRYTINKIITADKTVDLNEWIIQRLILQQLDENFLLRKPAKAKHAYLGAVKSEAETIMSLIAHTEHKDDKVLAEKAFDLGKKEIGAKAFNIIPKEELNLTALNTSIDQLMQLKPLLKPKILKACAMIIMADGEKSRKGIELLRTLSTCLDCPLPIMNI